MKVHAEMSMQRTDWTKTTWAKRFIWNPSICESDCSKSCAIDENCKYRKRLVSK